MRVTDRSLFESSIARNGSARERHAEAVERAATGLKVQHAWDSPMAPLIARHRFDGERLRAINETVRSARGDLAVLDGALGGMVNVLHRGVELAVQLSNDTYSADDRRRAADEVRALFDEVVRLGNVDSGGRFLLAGTAESTRPFDAIGAYQGDGGERRIEVGPGTTEVVSFRGDVVLGGANGGIDVLVALDAFASALESNDTATIRSSVATVNTAVSQVALAHARLGGVLLGLEVAEVSNSALADTADERRADLTDVDLIEAASALAFAERALEASFAATARSFAPSLLDTLR